MIDFVSLLLGLITGLHPVELSVVGEVAAVEVRLNGEVIETLDGPPWRLNCDFGKDLRPHELLAVAVDEHGKELGQARRWVNLSQIESSDAALAFTTGEDGWPTAVGVAWEAIGQRQPPQVKMSFNGVLLAVADSERVPLPDYDPNDLHVVSAEIAFERETTHLDAVFGGENGREISTELTAVAIHLQRGRLPNKNKLRGWFQKDGKTLTVHGVENGPAEVIVVRDPLAVEGLQRLSSTALSSTLGDRQSNRAMLPGWLGEDVHLRVMTPQAAPLTSAPVVPDLFLRSSWTAMEKTGFLWQSVTTRPQNFPIRLTNATAVAGLLAHAGTRRRAVVLMLGGSANDSLAYDEGAVRSYLRNLGVPLFVWSMVPPPEAPEWPEARDMQPNYQHLKKRIRSASREVRENLDSQRIVWLRGRYLPQSITLAPEAEGICLVGTPGCGS